MTDSIIRETTEKEKQKKRSMKRLLLIVNCLLLAIGNTAGPLIMRLYFVKGGNRIWLSSFLETAGFPIMIIPLAVAYNRRRRRAAADGKVITMKLPLFLASAGVGILTGFDDYLYASGVGKLPVSTSSLIIASQLVFTAGFAYLMVRQKFTPYSVNAVVLLTVGAAVLATHTSGDRPEGETTRQYVIGFMMTVAAAVTYGFILPLVEWVYMKTKQRITYTLVLEFQCVYCFFASLVCLCGMIIGNDFKVIPTEAKEFELGEPHYYVVLLISAIVWQGFFLGGIGVTFCASSLLSGIIIAVCLPVTEVLAVIFYQESFKAEKGISLVLSLWGFVSYFYGDIKKAKDSKKARTKAELPQTHTIPIDS